MNELGSSGGLHQAERYLRYAVRERGGPEDHNNLGMVLFTQGHVVEAITCYRTAIVLRPGYGIALNNLGVALAGVERWEEALDQHRAALVIAPHHTEALNNLGSALMSLKKHRQAVERFRAAQILMPDFTSAQVNLVRGLIALGRRDEATIGCRRLVRHKPQRPEFHLMLADLLRQADRHEAAIIDYRRAIALQPEDEVAWSEYGRALVEVGDGQAGRYCLQRAITIKPQRPFNALLLVRAGKLAETDRYLAPVLALEKRLSSLDTEERIDAHFALGRALEDIGRHDESFAHLLAGNALKRSTQPYDEERSLGRLKRIAEVFTSEWLRSRPRGSSSSDLPIFIVGMPRSGSTLVEQILACHPDVFGMGERDLLRESLQAAGLHVRGRPFPDTVPEWTGERLSIAADTYLGGLRKQAGSRSVIRITDKFLGNFRHVGLIHLMFPGARILHTVRDPIDTCLSCFSLYFASQPFTFDLGELGRYYRAYEQLMGHWHDVLPGTILDVRYEAVVDDVEREARRVVAHCGLDWHDSCLSFHETKRPVRTSSAMQVHRPIYRDSIGRRRPDKKTLRPLLDALELSLIRGEPQTPPRSGRPA